MLKKNSIYTVKITDINNLGYGVCRVEGIVTFVAGAVTGDEAQIKLIKVTKSYCVARMEKLILPSEHRIDPECPLFPKCGGCVYRHVSYDYEKELKRGYVESAFRKAGIDAEIAGVTSDNKITGYRNKVQYPVGKNGEIGYYRTKTHDIIECESCLLEEPVLHDIKRFISDFIKENTVSCLRHIYLRCGAATGEVMVCLVSEKKDFNGLSTLCNEVCERFDAVKCFAINVNDKDTNVILGEKTYILRGRPYIEDELMGCRFRISPMSFYQVNHSMTGLLYSKAAELCGLKEGESFIDLYCGCGTIGLCIAKKTKTAELSGVEIIPDAIENAKINAELNGIENASFICGDASDAPLKKCGCVIVDPPRKGLTEKLIAELAEADIERIVYVSCNPDTLARDCAVFIEKGYQLSKVYPFDLFPRTGHVENVVCLSRKSTQETKQFPVN
ncbi:MAG: 23S rRNA (uracil(1939)-C(5))-methyltransferase RlmD [Ruminococcaceae bacterium]|nr:23S rRNA (uracil(1939)-C(5))-methyltransferase RlmD [Oscillospiraceae bacterium]